MDVCQLGFAVQRLGSPLTLRFSYKTVRLLFLRSCVSACGSSSFSKDDVDGEAIARGQQKAKWEGLAAMCSGGSRFNIQVCTQRPF